MAKNWRLETVFLGALHRETTRASVPPRLIVMAAGELMVARQWALGRQGPFSSAAVNLWRFVAVSQNPSKWAVQVSASGTQEARPWLRIWHTATVKVPGRLQSCEGSLREDPIASSLSQLLSGFSSSWTAGWRPLQLFATSSLPYGRSNMAAGSSQVNRKARALEKENRPCSVL